MSDHTADCNDETCACPDDVFWGRLLGDDDPCSPGKDWVSTAFGSDGDTEAPGTEFDFPSYCTHEESRVGRYGPVCACGLSWKPDEGCAYVRARTTEETA